MVTILMNPTTPNAFASFYSLSPTERVAAAVRLVAVLKRERRRVQKLHSNAIKRDIVFGCQGGETDDIHCHLLTLTEWVMWLERRYGFTPVEPPGPLLTHLRSERREQIGRDERPKVERRPGRF
ncbi:hypothetical protein J8F10_37495 [Gemmata sp. G18]|uniref:Uncharacterized protein n=1 Tax=Gemmata palustris TaxID=2822762 RepID=A0ABS5C4N1_9BACT|nr:hypothetical protein [Gemmata palustris]MBP3960951.1 hypothetical protein [Gemmata palustris]